MITAALLLFRRIPPIVYVLALVVALLIAANWQGRSAVRQEWKEADAKRLADENTAVEVRNESNRLLAKAQAATNARISNAHQNEITRVRAAVASAPRLRIGPALCNRSASPAEASVSSRSNGTDTASRVLSAEMDGIFRALVLETESVAATGRACQAAAREHGFVAD